MKDQLYLENLNQLISQQQSKIDIQRAKLIRDQILLNEQFITGSSEFPSVIKSDTNAVKKREAKLASKDKEVK